MPQAVGSEVEGKVTGITNYGAFIDLGGGEVGLVHISQVSDNFVTDIKQFIKVGDQVKIKVMGQVKPGKYDLSMKMVGKDISTVRLPTRKPHFKRSGGQKKDRPIPGTFEDKITQFLKSSEDRLLDIKRNTESKQGGSKRKKF